MCSLLTFLTAFLFDDHCFCTWIRRSSVLQEFLAKQAEDEEDEPGEDMVDLGDKFLIFRELAEKLYPHQKEGVLWMWRLHQQNKGGILADDMG